MTYSPDYWSPEYRMSMTKVEGRVIIEIAPWTHGFGWPSIEAAAAEALRWIRQDNAATPFEGVGL